MRFAVSPLSLLTALAIVVQDPTSAYVLEGQGNTAPQPSPDPQSPDCIHTRSPLNVAACKTLLDSHIPTILNVDQTGDWSTDENYRYDLSGYRGPGNYSANSCVLTLAAHFAKTQVFQFKPRVFINLAKSSILPRCGADNQGFSGGTQLLVDYVPLSVTLLNEE